MMHDRVRWIWMLSGAAVLLAGTLVFWSTTSPDPLPPVNEDKPVDVDGMVSGIRADDPPTSPSTPLDRESLSTDDVPAKTRQLEYSLTARSAMHLTMPGGAECDLEHEIDGTLRFTVLKQRDQETLVRVSLPGTLVRSQFPGESRRRLRRYGGFEEDDSESVIVRMGADGATLDYEFSEGAADEVRELLLDLVSSFRIVVPDRAGDTWTVEEDDSIGSYVAEYSREPVDGLVTKTKREYTGLSHLEGARVKKLRSASQARLDPDLRWPVAVLHENHVSLWDPNPGVTVSVFFRGQISLLSVDGQPRRTERMQTSDPALKGVLEEMLDLLNGDSAKSRKMWEAEEQLTALIHHRPELLEVLEEDVRSTTLDPRLATVVLAAIARADSLRARAFLIGILEDDGIHPRRQRAAANALRQIGSLDEETGASLSRVLDAGGSRTVVSELERALLWALVTVPGHDAAADVFEEFLRRERDARADGLLTVWLEGLSHFADERAIQSIQRSLAHGDEDVREAAVRALRNPTGPATTQILVDVLAVDGSARVRAAAARTLAQKGSDRAMDEVAVFLQTEPRASIRLALVEGLASSPGPSLRTLTLLRHVSMTDPDDEIRSLVEDRLKTL